MIKVCFVGDSPSNTNSHKDIAFVGAKCFPRLVEWIGQIKPDYYVCLNSSTATDVDKIFALRDAGFIFIVLGNKASKVLKTELLIEHYLLPHPSGLNRKLNNDMEIRLSLIEAHLYVRLEINSDSGGYKNIITPKEKNR